MRLHERLKLCSHLDLPDAQSRLHVHQIDLLHPTALDDLISRTQPDEFYNLAGQSSVSKSFADPHVHMAHKCANGRSPARVYPNQKCRDAVLSGFLN